jgi:sugar lactone lactonase YvrE
MKYVKELMPSKRRSIMQYVQQGGGALIAAVAVAFALSAAPTFPQGIPDPNAAPNPYRLDEGWAKLPPGRKWGATFGMSVDRNDGRSMWAFDRCEQQTLCADSHLAPIFHFDPTGKVIANFGADIFAAPHGLFADQSGNVWVTDFQIRKGKGYTVKKFSPDGKLLMTLGKEGVAGDNDSQDLFNAPSNVVIAPDDSIFVGDGHGMIDGKPSNARIVHFSKDGKFIKAWGHRGTGPGEFETPHMLAMDSQGRLFVADRGNSRIQIFDQDGRYLTEWKQFGRPSGVYIDKNDNMYVSDSTSTEKTNPGFGQGVRIGSAKDGRVTAYIPETKELSALEGVAADDAGNIYGGYTNTLNFTKGGPSEVNFRRWVKKSPGL